MSQTLELLSTKCISSASGLVTEVLAGRRQRIQTVNLHHLALARSSPQFAETIALADKVTADGWPIVLGLKLKGVGTQRVTGSELLVELLRPGCGGKKLRVGLIGANDEAGELLGVLCQRAGHELVFREHGSKSGWQAAVVSPILDGLDVQLLLVAVTPPWGDTFGREVHDAGFGGTILAVGGAVDMVVGQRAMAPSWAKTLRAEWLYRLIQEPRRLFRRYIMQCIPALILEIGPLCVDRLYQGLRIRLCREMQS